MTAAGLAVGVGGARGEVGDGEAAEDAARILRPAVPLDAAVLRLLRGRAVRVPVAGPRLLSGYRQGCEEEPKEER